jgi:L-asparaginase
MIEKKVLLITMGGTISGQVSANEIEKESMKDSKEFASILNNAKNSIEITEKIKTSINHIPLCEDLDSSDIKPDHWSLLAQTIKNEYDNYDSFLITHGTNTMGYTAAALSFSLANLDKPVIITGSQVPLGLPGSDAVANLENSLRVAVLNREKNQIKGVVAVFGGHIITGTKVKKETEFDYDAFKSFGGSSIGRIGRIIKINETNLEKHLSYLQTARFNRARSSTELICESDFDMRIASITEFPGMDSDIFRCLVEEKDIKGFILRAFGAGDASTSLIPALEYLKEQKIPIIITTQAPNGNSNFQVNEPGEKIAKNKLAIPAYDMNIESQTTKLAWLLAKKKNRKLTYEKICEEMVHDIRGEVEVIWEVKM